MNPATHKLQAAFYFVIIVETVMSQVERSPVTQPEEIYLSAINSANS